MGRFVQDDAYISFRYARNWAQGHGLVWNLGEPPVEGYTNFLWTVWMGLGIGAGLDPRQWSYALGITFGVGSLAASARLARQLGLDGRWVNLVLALLITNFSFVSYMTGGLETSSQTFFLMCLASLSLTLRSKSDSLKLGAVWSLVAALALLTRMDSAIFIVGWSVYVFYPYIRGRRWSELLKLLASMVLPACVVVVPWLVWKVSYYGSLLPNTFYAKATSKRFNIFGLAYTGSFVMEYGLWILLLVSLRVRRVCGALPEALSPVLALMGVWWLYIIKVGGDFMEFRFFICVIPLIMICASSMLARLNDQRVTVAVCALLGLMSLQHTVCFRGHVNGVASIDFLHTALEECVEVGQGLEALMKGGGEDVRIAVMPLGGISYHSNLFALDLHGLTDAWVARNGLYYTDLPGHYLQAPYDYIERREVHLLLGHPVVGDASAPFVPLCGQIGRPDHDPRTGPYDVETVQCFQLHHVTQEDIGAGIEVVEVPMAGGRQRAAMLYIRRHPHIERLKASGQVISWPLR
jgi:arabinofuranosyltransferase